MEQESEVNKGQISENIDDDVFEFVDEDLDEARRPSNDDEATKDNLTNEAQSDINNKPAIIVNQPDDTLTEVKSEPNIESAFKSKEQNSSDTHSKEEIHSNAKIEESKTNKVVAEEIKSEDKNVVEGFDGSNIAEVHHNDKDNESKESKEDLPKLEDMKKSDRTDTKDEIHDKHVSEESVLEKAEEHSNKVSESKKDEVSSNSDNDFKEIPEKNLNKSNASVEHEISETVDNIVKIENIEENKNDIVKLEEDQAEVKYKLQQVIDNGNKDENIEVKSQTIDIEEVPIKEEEDLFDFVDENDDLPRTNNANNQVEQSDSDSEDKNSNVIERNKIDSNKSLEKVSEKSHKELEPADTKQEAEEDEFDFVDEDEPTSQSNHAKTDTQPQLAQNTTDNPNPTNNADEDDMFEFVEETQEEDQKPKQTESKQLVTNTDDDNDEFFEFVEDGVEEVKPSIPTPVKPAGKNKDLILQLITEYKKENISDGLYEGSQLQLTSKQCGNEFITDFHLDIKKHNHSIQKHIDTLSYFNTIPEAVIRPLPTEEIVKLGKSYDLNLKQKLNDQTKFSVCNSNIPNSTIQDMYYKLIDIKNIYLNSLFISNGDNAGYEVDPEPSNKEEAAPNSVRNVDKGEEFDFVEEEVNTKIENKVNKVKTNEMSSRPLSKTATIEKMKSKTLHSDDDMDFKDDMNDDIGYEKPAQNQIQIDKALFSIIMDTNSIQVPEKKPEPEVLMTPEDKRISVLNEDQMLELLRGVGVQNEKKEDKPSTNENDINVEFSKVIADLPNYKFVLSKYVEYPDSLFNL